ncbi:MAG: hypothetical protein Q9172_002959 [Xanthocarpia lactea]
MPSVSQKETQYQIDHIHDNRINEILVSNSICIGLAAIAVLLRFAARRLSKAKIAADDYMIVAALSGDYICRELKGCKYVGSFSSEACKLNNAQRCPHKTSSQLCKDTDGRSVCIVSIYRVTTVGDLSRSDPSWSDVDPCVWSVVEVGVGIVSACLITLRPLWTSLVNCRSIAPNLQLWRHRGRSEDSEGLKLSDTPAIVEASESHGKDNSAAYVIPGT